MGDSAVHASVNVSVAALEAFGFHCARASDGFAFSVFEHFAFTGGEGGAVDVFDFHSSVSGLPLVRTKHTTPPKGGSILSEGDKINFVLFVLFVHRPQS